MLKQKKEKIRDKEFKYTNKELRRLGIFKDLKKKIRHLYDLHKLLQKKEFANFFNSKDFEEMLLKVANDDVKSYRNDNAWLIYHPSKALIFSDSNKLRTELKKVYLDEFQNYSLKYPDFHHPVVSRHRYRDYLSRQ